MASSQNADWESNVYLLTTTRILGVFGMTYLIKISYQFYKKMRASDDRPFLSGRSIEAEEENLGLELGINGFFAEGAATPGLDSNIDIGDMVQVHRPLPAHCPGFRDIRRLGSGFPNGEFRGYCSV